MRAQKEIKAVIETIGINTTSLFISLIANCFSMVIWGYTGMNHMVEWHYHVAITTERVAFSACFEWNKIPTLNVILKSTCFWGVILVEDNNAGTDKSHSFRKLSLREDWKQLKLLKRRHSFLIMRAQEGDLMNKN